MLLIAGGTLVHLLLDEMWLTPRTLFWPFFGTAFPREEATLTEWVGNMLLALVHNAAVFIPEIIGFIVLVAFVIVLNKRHMFAAFLRYGQLNN